MIEDDYDGEFRYERRAVGALQAMAPDHVVYIGTASKALGPAVGLAWAVVPKPRLAGLIAQRSVLDEPRDTLNQLTLAEFIAAHSYDRHVRRMRAEYRRRREYLATLLAARVPAARLAGVPAGIQALVILPAGTDPDRAVAAGLRRGLAFEALHEYAAEAASGHPAAVVLGFGASPAARALTDIEQAVAAIEECAADRLCLPGHAQLANSSNPTTVTTRPEHPSLDNSKKRRTITGYLSRLGMQARPAPTVAVLTELHRRHLTARRGGHG